MATDTAAPATARRNWQLPTFLLGLVSFWLAVTLLSPPPDAASRHDRRLAALAAALERVPPDAAEIQTHLAELTEGPHTPQSHALIGSAYVALALTKPTESPDSWKLALEHFSAVEASALPADDAARVAYRRALAEATLGRGDPAALIAALMNPPPGEDRGECPRLRAECALRLPQPDLARAREELTAYLGGPHRASAAAADRAKLTLAELNIALGDAARARGWLRDVSASAPAEVRASAMLALARLAASQQNWREAADLLETAVATKGLSEADSQAAYYELGTARRKLGDADAAITAYEAAARGTGVISGLAAFRLAEMLSADAARRTTAADWLERAAPLLASEGLPAADRAAGERIVRELQAAGEFAQALRCAAVLDGMLNDAASRLLRVDVQAAWAEALQQRGDAGASARYAAAAAELEKLAGEAANADEAKGHFRRAALLLRAGGDRTAALAAIDRVLTHNPQDQEMNLFRAELLPPSEFDGIRAALEQAMNAPGERTLEARLKLALLLVNRGQDLLTSASGAASPEAARREAEQVGQLGRDLLRQVADAAAVPPQAAATHEQALFEHGRLGLRDTRFADAEAAFKKQLSLYPNGSMSGYGRLWLVCSLLQQARKQEGQSRILEEALAHLKPLTLSDDPYLRTYGEIWTANTLLELGDALAAVSLSKDLMAQYRGKPEELVAGKLLFYAYLKQPRPDPAEAARTLARMEEAFAALPRQAYPNDPEYSWEKWKSELPVLAKVLRDANRQHDP